jgi:hypothetical protein
VTKWLKYLIEEEAVRYQVRFCWREVRVEILGGVKFETRSSVNPIVSRESV